MKRLKVGMFLIMLMCNLPVFAAYFDARFAFLNGDFRGAYDACIVSAQTGDADCQNAIGVLYLEGKSVQQNTRMAIQWLKRAADKQHAAAQYNLGLAYVKDQPNFRDYARSAEVMLRAAENGHVQAQLLIGNYFAEGKGVSIHSEKAFSWWKTAAERANPMAQNNLGWAFLHGIGTKKNVPKAVEWLKKASDQQDDIYARDLALKNLEEIPSSQKTSNTLDEVSLRVSNPASDGKVEIGLQVPEPERLISLKINHEDVFIGSGMRTTFARYVPLGESEIQLMGELSNGRLFKIKKTIIRNIGKNHAIDAGLGDLKIVQSGDPDAVAVVIGAEEYEKLPRSNFSENDASRFFYYARNVLKIPEHKIRILGSKNSKRSDILLALKNWLPAEITPGKTKVFVFYSGHGIASLDSKKYYLLPTDSNLQLLEETAVGIDQVLKLVHLGKPREVLFLIDSCFSGAARDGKVLTANARPVLQITKAGEIPPHTTIISSSSDSQISLSSEETGHGLFSFHLMIGLNGGADENKDRVITANELLSYVVRKVAIDARRRGSEQQPHLIGSADSVVVSARDQ